MSTSFIIHDPLERLCNKLRLTLRLITTDPHAHDAEYRIHRIRPLDAAIDAISLFQGGIDRCSDFVRGYAAHADIKVFG